MDGAGAPRSLKEGSAFFRLHPARFHHLGSFDDSSSQAGLPVATMDITRN